MMNSATYSITGGAAPRERKDRLTNRRDTDLVTDGCPYKRRNQCVFYF